MQDHGDIVDTRALQASSVRGSNQSGIRAHNERLVLSLIRQRGPMAKSELARVSGLSAQTVSVIMRALEKDGLLKKGKPVRGRVGQPSVPMRLAGDGAYFLGLKVGRRSVELVLTDFLGRVIDRANRVYAYPRPETALEFARSNMDRMLGDLSPARRRRVAGMGIAMPFFLWSWARHLGVPEDEMAGWRGFDLRAEIAARADFPVFLQNDATAACGAELVFGTGPLPRDFLYIYIGYFVGGGVVLNNALHTGRGNSGALGPLPVHTPEGVRQLIDVASLSGLEARLLAEGHDGAHLWSGTADWAVDRGILDAWTEAAAAGLAHAIVAACALIDFEAVLIDGWIPADLRDRLVERTAARMRDHDLAGLDVAEIRAGTIGADARSLGAASLPLSERFLVEGAPMPGARGGVG